MDISFRGGKVKVNELCESCQVNEGEEYHSCPYAADVLNDFSEDCNCCEDCQFECAMDI